MLEKVDRWHPLPCSLVALVFVLLWEPFWFSHFESDLVTIWLSQPGVLLSLFVLVLNRHAFSLVSPTCGLLTVFKQNFLSQVEFLNVFTCVIYMNVCNFWYCAIDYMYVFLLANKMIWYDMIWYIWYGAHFLGLGRVLKTMPIFEGQ